MTQIFSNNVESTVAVQLLSGGTSLTVSVGDGALFPSPGADFFLVTLYKLDGEGNENTHEVVQCTSRTGDVLTIVRAYEGSANQYEISDRVSMRLTKQSIINIQTETDIPASTTVSGNVELADITETNAGTDDTKAVTPDGLEDWEGSAQVITVGTIATGTWNADVILEAKLENQSGTNTGDEPAADLTTPGIIEIADVTETNTGTDATRAVSPDGLDGWTGSPQIVTVGTLTGGDVDAAVTVASIGASGRVELATITEVNTGTDATRAVTPDSLEGSALQIKVDLIEDLADVTDTANVNSAGATMNADTTMAGNGYFLDTDLMTENDATKVASQQSIKAYVDGAVTSSVIHQGGYNATTNTPDLDVSPSAGILQGWMYAVTAVGDFFSSSDPLEIGDVLIANQDTPTTASHWTIVQKNLEAASITVAGFVELADVTETNTGTDASRAVTPDGLDSWIGSAQITTVGTIDTGTWSGDVILEAKLENQSGTNTGDEPNASESVLGIVEMATVTETNAGSSQILAVTPNALAGWTGDTSVTTLGTVVTGIWGADIIPEAKLENQSGTNTGDQDAGDIEAIVSHDNLQGVTANEHIDWTNATQNISTTGSVTTNGGVIHVDETGNAAGAIFRISADDGQVARWDMRTGALVRWRVQKNSVAESGSDAGSDFTIARFDDAGGALGTAFTIDRATGNITIGGTLSVQGTLIPLSNSTTSDPTTTDDDNSGYTLGSVWVNTTTDTVFIAADVTTSAAIWNKFISEDAVIAFAVGL